MVHTRRGCRAVLHAFRDNSCSSPHSTSYSGGSGDADVAVPGIPKTQGAAWTLVRNRENRELRGLALSRVCYMR